MRTRLKANGAHSMYNGIQFFSKRHKGYIAISTIDELGNIKAEWTTKKKYKNERSKDDKRADRKNKFITLLCVLPFSIIYGILLEWSMKKDPMLGIRFFLLGFASILLGAFIIDAHIEGKKEKNYFKFHSAEHMVLNAYRKLKRVPTIEEIHKYSRFSNTCGTNGTTQMVINFTLMFLCTFISNKLYMLIGMISVTIIVYILIMFGRLNFLQRLTTRTPTNMELTVAIAGMNVWLENEIKE